jgi:hypothetical protein
MRKHGQNKPRDTASAIIEEAGEIFRDEHKLNSIIEDLVRAGDRKELLDALRRFKSGTSLPAESRDNDDFDPGKQTADDAILEYLYDRRAEQRGSLTKKRLLSIDLSEYDRLRTYPTHGGKNWQMERDRVLFLQTALRAGISWLDVSLKTQPYFGKTLNPPFVPVCKPFTPAAFQPPVYDLSRQTPDEWAREADAEWQKHRNDLVRSIGIEYESHITADELKMFDRRRVATEGSGKKAPIIDERTAYAMAAKYFFWTTSWSALAEEYPPDAGWVGNPIQKAKQKQKRVHQIQRRVQPVISRLGLPVHIRQ